jgi:CHAT domain-containing protein
MVAMRLQLLAYVGGLCLLGFRSSLAPAIGAPVVNQSSVQATNLRQQQIDRRIAEIIESPEIFILNAQGDMRQARTFYQQQQNQAGLQSVKLAEATLAYRDGEYWQADMLLLQLTRQLPDQWQRHRQLLETFVAIDKGDYQLAHARWNAIQVLSVGNVQDDVRFASAELLRYRGRYHAALVQLNSIPATTALKQFQIDSSKAEINLNLGQYATAIALYETANRSKLVLSSNWGRRSVRQFARNQVNLGKAHRLLNDPEQAQQAFQIAAASLQQISDRDAQILLQVEMGLTQIDMQQWPQALRTLNEANDRARGWTKSSTRIMVLSALGYYYQAQGQLESAITRYQQAIALSQQHQDAIGQAKGLMSLGEVYLKQQRWDEAIATLTQSIEVYEKMRPGLLDQDKIALVDSQAQAYQLLQAAQVGKGDQQSALITSERGRARAFIEQLAQQLLPATVRDQLLTATTPTIAALQATAKRERATLVSYSILRDSRNQKEHTLYIWVISPEGAIVLRSVDLTGGTNPKSAISETVKAARNAVIGAMDQATKKAALQSAYARLITPIADLLPKNADDRVVIIPQGALFLVPFQALQNEQGEYLIQNHTLQVVPSIQALEFVQQRQSQRKGQPLIVGNPNPMPENLDRLPGAEAEAQVIGKMLKTEAIIGAQATEAGMVERMEKSNLLHFATHGLLDDSRGFGGAIALVKGPGNDGLLTADEIFPLRLQADLAVLSACDTGRGRITGDGVIGLSRSFMSAGVPSVVVSLWAVPDQPTQVLMTDFYRQLQRQPDKAKALRQAMLNTMQQYPQPNDWAGFTLVGRAD